MDRAQKIKLLKEIQSGARSLGSLKQQQPSITMEDLDRLTDEEMQPLWGVLHRIRAKKGKITNVTEEDFTAEDNRVFEHISSLIKQKRLSHG